MSGLLFSVQDKDGNTVELSGERWELHIVLKHPEVATCVEEIKALIHQPSVVTRDHQGVHHLARLGAAGGRWRNLYLEVVVRYRVSPTGTRGDVLTVHFNAAPPKGDLEWMSR